MIYPQDFDEKIEFDFIKETLKKYCLSTMGAERVDKISLITNTALLRTELSKTDEFKTILIKYEEFPTDNYIDAGDIIKKTETTGAFIEVHELYSLKKSLETIKSILRFFTNHKDEFPTLQNSIKKVKIHSFVLDKINAIITSNGKIKDNASPELNNVRREIRHKKASISKLLNEVLNSAKASGWVDKDLSASLVNGRTVIPIESTYKRKIKGLIQDVSSTGKTTFIEPAEVVELNNQIVDLEQDEKHEIYKILKQFTEEITPYAEDLEASYEFLSEVDFLRAKAKFAIATKSIKPGISSKKIISLNNARHPILYLKFIEQTRAVVPLNVEINQRQRIILISGPNAGGKSIALKTVVLIQYMFQSGLLVPVGGGSDLGIFHNFFIDIGDEQSLENDLSTYSSHLLNMKYFIKNADENTLVFIDEFGTGTEPMLGGAIAESVLEEINNKQPFGVITTHYTNLKHFAAFTDGIENAAMLFDTGKIEPIYKLDVGKPGSSFSFETARKIGIPENVLKRAEDKAGKENIEFDKHLRQLLRDKKYWEDKRYQIKSKDAKLENVLDKYQQDLSEIKKLKKEIIAKAKQEAVDIVKNANREIENTIKQIKIANAEKEKTKEIRREFENKKHKLKNIKTEDNQVESKLQSVNRRLSKFEKSKPKTVEIDNSKIRISDKVRLIESNNVGEVVELNNKNAVVAFGNLLTSISLKKLEKVSNNEYKRLNKSGVAKNTTSSYTMAKRANFTPNIDLRGERVDEALSRVVQFIDEALMFGYSKLTILHGTGTGALKQAIRQYLNTLEFVASAKDEKIELGGAGITVVKLDI